MGESPSVATENIHIPHVRNPTVARLELFDIDIDPGQRMTHLDTYIQHTLRVSCVMVNTSEDILEGLRLIPDEGWEVGSHPEILDPGDMVDLEFVKDIELHRSHNVYPGVVSVVIHWSGGALEADLDTSTYQISLEEYDEPGLDERMALALDLGRVQDAIRFLTPRRSHDILERFSTEVKRERIPGFGRIPTDSLRGRWHDYDGIPVRVTYHPAYLLRSPQQKQRSWQDLLTLSGRLEQLAGEL